MANTNQVNVQNTNQNVLPAINWNNLINRPDVINTLRLVDPTIPPAPYYMTREQSNSAYESLNSLDDWIDDDTPPHVRARIENRRIVRELYRLTIEGQNARENENLTDDERNARFRRD